MGEKFTKKKKTSGEQLNMLPTYRRSLLSERLEQATMITKYNVDIDSDENTHHVNGGNEDNN